MCGIVGYIGAKKAAPLLVASLKNLEYRGYDSAGIAIAQQDKIYTFKGVGKIKEVFKDMDLNAIEGTRGISHSRWATHGGVSKENSHPHLSNNGKISVVHNGIIENYQELRDELIKKGYLFKSQTDTEVIPNLIQEQMDVGNFFEDAVRIAVKKLEGSYALGIIYSDEEKVIGIRKESPLVVGVDSDGFFIASDIPSFLEYTKKVVYLHNNDMVTLTKEGMKFFNILENLPVKRVIDSVEWDKEQAQKGNFEHFMLKEITEQTETIKRASLQKTEDIIEIANMMKDAESIYFIAAGSSYNASLSGHYKLASIAKLKTTVCLASEFSNFRDFINNKTLIIAVSQSGETADVLEAVSIAKELGAKIVSIVNVRGSTLPRISDKYLLQNIGPEICVLATKSYTSQLAILIILTYAVSNKLEEGKDKLHELIQYIFYLTSVNTKEYIKNLAEKLRYVEHLYLIGRDLQYPTALEAALKIKEVSYIHAEGFAGGELKHGTIALIEKGTPCIVFSSNMNEKAIVSNATELKARGAYIIGIGPKNNEVFDFFIKVREADEGNSICQIIPIQILAYQLALLRGHDPDKPRNLAKVITVK